MHMAKKPQTKQKPNLFYIKCTEELKAIQVFNVIKFFCLFFFRHILYFLSAVMSLNQRGP